MPPTFLMLEKAGGKPVELFIFSRAGQVWRYTDGQRAVTVNGLSYEPATIARSAQTDSSEEARSTITVTLDRSVPVVAALLQGSPSYRRTTVAIFRYQPGASDKAAIGRGDVASVRRHGETAEVTVSQIGYLTQLAFPRLTFQGTCNHAVYDPYCGVDKSAFTFTGTVSGILAAGAVGGSPDGPGIQFTVASSPAEFGTAGYFSVGYLVAGGDIAFVISHTVASGTALLVLLGPVPPALILGASVLCVAGCDRSKGTCIAKFNNLKNYLGFDLMPTRDPFQTAME